VLSFVCKLHIVSPKCCQLVILINTDLATITFPQFSLDQDHFDLPYLPRLGKDNCTPPMYGFRRWRNIFHFTVTLCIKLWNLGNPNGRNLVCSWPLYAGSCHALLLSNTGVCDVFHRELNFPCGESGCRSALLLPVNTNTQQKSWNLTFVSRAVLDRTRWLKRWHIRLSWPNSSVFPKQTPKN
jgi:hypothetical protein